MLARAVAETCLDLPQIFSIHLLNNSYFLDFFKARVALSLRYQAEALSRFQRRGVALSLG